MLTDHRLEQRKAALRAKLEGLGEVTIADMPRSRRRRLIELSSDAPGLGLPTLASFAYRELFERTSRGWELVAYAHEYLDRERDGRHAYHWHDGVTHAHCREASEKPSDAAHYRAVKMDVFEAHDEFARIYVSATPISCADLLPMLDWMDR